MKTQTPLERIFEIRDHIRWLKQIKSTKPNILVEIIVYWLNQIELLKIKINKNYESTR